MYWQLENLIVNNPHFARRGRERLSPSLGHKKGVTGTFQTRKAWRELIGFRPPHCPVEGVATRATSSGETEIDGPP